MIAYKNWKKIKYLIKRHTSRLKILVSKCICKNVKTIRINKSIRLIASNHSKLDFFNLKIIQLFYLINDYTQKDAFHVITYGE